MDGRQADYTSLRKMGDSSSRKNISTSNNTAANINNSNNMAAYTKTEESRPRVFGQETPHVAILNRPLAFQIIKTVGGKAQFERAPRLPGQRRRPF